MSGPAADRRSLDYLVLRTCERFSVEEQRFAAYPYETQLRLLAYGQLRQLEENAQGRGE